MRLWATQSRGRCPCHGSKVGTLQVPSTQILYDYVILQIKAGETCIYCIKYALDKEKSMQASSKTASTHQM